MTDIKKSRKQKLAGCTYQAKTGCGTVYITINENDDTPFEMFITMGKAGGCAASQLEAIGRSISLGLRYGVPPNQFIKQLQGISCHSPMVEQGNKILSCADAIAKTFALHMNDKPVLKDKEHG